MSPITEVSLKFVNGVTSRSQDLSGVATLILEGGTPGKLDFRCYSLQNFELRDAGAVGYPPLLPANTWTAGRRGSWISAATPCNLLEGGMPGRLDIRRYSLQTFDRRDAGAVGYPLLSLPFTRALSVGAGAAGFPLLSPDRAHPFPKESFEVILLKLFY